MSPVIGAALGQPSRIKSVSGDIGDSNLGTVATAWKATSSGTFLRETVPAFLDAVDPACARSRLFATKANAADRTRPTGVVWHCLPAPLYPDSGTVFGANPVENDFAYDLRSQVIGATMGVDQYGYAYDPIGNRLTSTKNQASTTYTANQLNEYTAISGQPDPTYDNDGNMTSQGGWTYQWDAENRLIEAVQTPVQTDSKKLTFAYDYMSRRYSKKVYVYTAASQYELQSSITFVYDGWNMIRELDAMNGNAVIRSHVWGLDLSQTLQGAGGVGGLLGTLTSDSSLLTACYDANGNVTEYVASDGAIAAHYEYDPFGNTTASSGPSAGSMPHRFSSKYLDGETGLYYYGYRYYAPGTGRWISHDPIEEDGSINIYAFTDNESINTTDRLGLRGDDPYATPNFCCGKPAKIYAPESQCCCKKGKVVSSDLTADCELIDRKEVFTGVTYYTDRSRWYHIPIHRPWSIGQLFLQHCWFDVDGWTAGSYPNRDEPTGIKVPEDKKYIRKQGKWYVSQTDINMSPCDFKIGEFKSCVKAAGYKRTNWTLYNNCRDWVLQVVEDCKSKSRGCAEYP